jgi:hypothetical protein
MADALIGSTGVRRGECKDGWDGEGGRAQLRDGAEEWQKDLLLAALSKVAGGRDSKSVRRRRRLPCRLPDGRASCERSRSSREG